MPRSRSRSLPRRPHHPSAPRGVRAFGGRSAYVALMAGLALPAGPGLPALTAPLEAQEAPSVSPEAGPEATVQALYDLVTFPAGTTPDWDRGRALFLPEAVVVLRTARDATTTFTVEGWIQDFEAFIEDREVEKTGFTERIIRTHTVEFGDVAHVWVLYEAEIPGWDRPPQTAVDGFHLVRREGRWLIASIVNEIPGPDRPLPEVLQGNR